MYLHNQLTPINQHAWGGNCHPKKGLATPAATPVGSAEFNYYFLAFTRHFTRASFKCPTASECSQEISPSVFISVFSGFTARGRQSSSVCLLVSPLGGASRPRCVYWCRHPIYIYISMVATRGRQSSSVCLLVSPLGGASRPRCVYRCRH